MGNPSDLQGASNEGPQGVQPSGHPAASQGVREVDRTEMNAILGRFEISIADANDLAQLQDYRIMVIADDSGSMSMSSLLPHQRVLGQQSASRWEELRETLSMIVELAACLTPSGVDVTFLNREIILGLRSPSDKRFLDAFLRPPNGSTPLTQILRSLVERVNSIGDTERPILLIILTDGEPDEGPRAFTEELRKLVRKQSTRCTFKVQIMACTADDQAVGWLNAVDDEFQEVDVTDDYNSEKREVLEVARTRTTFTRGDWCMKAMLGPISAKFDRMDQGPSQRNSPADGAECFAGCEKGCLIL